MGGFCSLYVQMHCLPVLKKQWRIQKSYTKGEQDTQKILCFLTILKKNSLNTFIYPMSIIP